MQSNAMIEVVRRQPIGTLIKYDDEFSIFVGQLLYEHISLEMPFFHFFSNNCNITCKFNMLPLI